MSVAWISRIIPPAHGRDRRRRAHGGDGRMQSRAATAGAAGVARFRLPGHAGTVQQEIARRRRPGRPHPDPRGRGRVVRGLRCSKPCQPFPGRDHGPCARGRHHQIHGGGLRAQTGRGRQAGARRAGQHLPAGVQQGDAPAGTCHRPPAAAAPLRHAVRGRAVVRSGHGAASPDHQGEPGGPAGHGGADLVAGEAGPGI